MLTIPFHIPFHLPFCMACGMAHGRTARTGKDAMTIVVTGIRDWTTGMDLLKLPLQHNIVFTRDMQYACSRTNR